MKLHPEDPRLSDFALGELSDALSECIEGLIALGKEEVTAEIAVAFFIAAANSAPSPARVVPSLCSIMDGVPLRRIPASNSPHPPSPDSAAMLRSLPSGPR